MKTFVAKTFYLFLVHLLPMSPMMLKTSIPSPSYLVLTDGQTGEDFKPSTKLQPPPFGNRPLPHYPNGKPTSMLATTSTQQPEQVVFTVSRPQPSTLPAEQVEDHSMMIILLVFGSVILLLVVAISIVALMIIVHKYQSRRQKAWADLSEQQKVDRMKQTGYINPTYQFFDQVTK